MSSYVSTENALNIQRACPCDPGADLLKEAGESEESRDIGALRPIKQRRGESIVTTKSPPIIIGKKLLGMDFRKPYGEIFEV